MRQRAGEGSQSLRPQSCPLSCGQLRAYPKTSGGTPSPFCESAGSSGVASAVPSRSGVACAVLSASGVASACSRFVFGDACSRACTELVECVVYGVPSRSGGRGSRRADSARFRIVSNAWLPHMVEASFNPDIGPESGEKSQARHCVSRGCCYIGAWVAVVNQGD